MGLDRGVSGRRPVVEAKESSQAFPAYDRSGPVEVGGRQDELAVQALMVSLLMITCQILADRGAQMALARSTSLLRHPLLMERTKRSAYAFRLGLFGGRRIG
jgi:hypothetical protein